MFQDKMFQDTMSTTIHFNNGDFDSITITSRTGADNVLIEYKGKKYTCKYIVEYFSPYNTIMTKIYSNNKDFDDVTAISSGKNNDKVIVEYKNKKYICECVVTSFHSNATDLTLNTIFCNKIEEIQ